LATITHARIVSKAELEASDLPERVTVALTELAGAAKKGLLALSVGVGLAVVEEIFQEEVTRLVGPRGRHDPERAANRHGQEERQLTLGGRRVSVSKPRVRTPAGEEVPLRTYRAFASRDLLNEAAVERMLAGLSSRRYEAGLEPVGQLTSSGTSRSAVSRRFVAGTRQKLAELFGRDLSTLDLLAVFLDGVNVAEHCVVVALGVDSTGKKQPLGLWEGTTENKALCTSLLRNLIERGLDPEVPRLYVVDGGKGLHAAILACFGSTAFVQRCQIHKRRNILDHLPERERVFIGRKLDKAWAEPAADRAETALRALAKQLEVQHPGAAASLLEGLEETLTVTRLGLPPSLVRTFKSTNPVESMNSVGRSVTGNVKRWQDGQMVLRWMAAGMLEAEKQFRRIVGYRDLHVLKQALRERQEVMTGARTVA
jgi:transposase-like protein